MECTHTGGLVVQRSLASLCVFGIALSLTHATSAQAPPAPPPAAPSSWSADYAKAKQSLLDGHFDDARRELERLAASAATETDRSLALELAALAGAWKARGTHLVLESDIGDDTAIARRENRRTTDEIAVLYLSGVVYGLGTGGFIAVHTDPREPAGAILPALALGGAGAGGVALLDNFTALGYGVPQSIVTGMYLGLAEGSTWAIWNQARVYSRDEWKETTLANVIWGSATLGAIGGGIIGAAYGTTPGRASYVGSTGLWAGTLAGLVTGTVVPDDDEQDDSALLAGALGLNAGVIGGVLSARAVSPTTARVRFLDLGAVAGGVLFGGVYWSAAGRNVDRHPNALMGSTAVGIAFGLGLSWLFTRNMPQDRPEDMKKAGSDPFRLSLAPVNGGLTISASGAL